MATFFYLLAESILLGLATLVALLSGYHNRLLPITDYHALYPSLQSESIQGVIGIDELETLERPELVIISQLHFYRLQIYPMFVVSVAGAFMMCTGMFIAHFCERKPDKQITDFIIILVFILLYVAQGITHIIWVLVYGGQKVADVAIHQWTTKMMYITYIAMYSVEILRGLNCLVMLWHLYDVCWDIWQVRIFNCHIYARRRYYHYDYY